MDTMEHLLLKTKFAGWFGAVTTGGTWLTSDFVNGWLRTAILILGGVSGILSIWYIRKINHHREMIKAIDQAEREMAYCNSKECLIKGNEPEICPIEFHHRPSWCPKELHKSKLVIMIGFFRKLAKLAKSSDTK